MSFHLDTVRSIAHSVDSLRKLDGPRQDDIRRSSAADPGTQRTSSTSQTPSISVELNLFIPQESVNVEDVISNAVGFPVPVPGWPVDLDGIHAGDGREIGEEGTFRTQQIITVYDDPGANPPYRVEIDANIGVSHELDGDGNVIETAQASEENLQGNVVEVRDDGTIVVELSAETSNPVQVGAPGITYHVTVELRPNGDGSWSVSAQGKHDGFPGYEVLATAGGGAQEIVYGYDPRIHGSSPLALLGSEDVEFSEQATIEAISQTPEDAVQEHTDENGNVDAIALGADLAEMSATLLSVDEAFVADAMALVPEGERQAVADTFFDSLPVTQVPGGRFHSEHVSLADTPRGVAIILEMGNYTPARLADPAVYFTVSRSCREAIRSGDPTWCVLASEYLGRLSDFPEAQYDFASYLEPIYDDDEEGLQSTPEGRQLEAVIERVVD